ncbi:MAG TPA: DinB family protein [Thermoanaerobaculia bacterium]|nr:DinB family protein [Thermoanaerobaculia bacterium]
MSSNRTSGRPRKGEYAAYGEADVALVEGDDAVAALIRQRSRTVELFERFGEAGGRLAYAAGKWTVKGVLGHLADDERIYAYRALCIARGDPRPLPGFDENAYARAAGFGARTFPDLLADYEAVRSASITLFRGLDSEAWLRRGVANDHDVTPRGLAFHIAGHELHHLAILSERYLPLLSAGRK